MELIRGRCGKHLFQEFCQLMALFHRSNAMFDNGRHSNTFIHCNQVVKQATGLLPLKYRRNSSLE